jgi:hypothetical protein
VEFLDSIKANNAANYAGVRAQIKFMTSTRGRASVYRHTREAFRQCEPPIEADDSRVPLPIPVAFGCLVFSGYLVSPNPDRRFLKISNDNIYNKLVFGGQENGFCRRRLNRRTSQQCY